VCYNHGEVKCVGREPNSDARQVLIADDHPPTRAGIRAALEVADFHVCAEVGSGAEAIEAAGVHQPDVCLLDIHMPGNGLVAAATIAAEVPSTAVVMLTVSRDDHDLFQALRAGAVGYLLKDTDPDRLPAALEGVLAGEAAMPRALVARVIEEFAHRDRRRRLPLVNNRPVRLTSREWETLDAMRDGLSTAEIAEQFGVAPVTVRTHISAILRKLRVKDRQEALRLIGGGPGPG
jgi:DNA-binding NarL/FixJ family response regulator